MKSVLIVVGVLVLLALLIGAALRKVQAEQEAEAESEEAKPPGAAASEAKSARSVTEDELAPLAAEVAFVDRGRAAYQRGELAEAERALGTYEREFAAPRLLPEVLYLRMECASGRGDRARAGQLAERILRQHARSPHAARARAVLSAE